MGPSLNEIWAALAWGAVSSVGLLVGAIAGWFSRLSHHAIAMGMSVGAGLLLATVSVKLAADAIRIAGPVPAVVSLQKPERYRRQHPSCSRAPEFHYSSRTGTPVTS